MKFKRHPNNNNRKLFKKKKKITKFKISFVNIIVTLFSSHFPLPCPTFDSRIDLDLRYVRCIVINEQITFLQFEKK